jgi:hypothetical protein
MFWEWSGRIWNCNYNVLIYDILLSLIEILKISLRSSMIPTPTYIMTSISLLHLFALEFYKPLHWIWEQCLQWIIKKSFSDHKIWFMINTNKIEMQLLLLREICSMITWDHHFAYLSLKSLTEGQVVSQETQQKCFKVMKIKILSLWIMIHSYIIWISQVFQQV